MEKLNIYGLSNQLFKYILTLTETTDANSTAPTKVSTNCCQHLKQ
jgi:hypothetical protein